MRIFWPPHLALTFFSVLFVDARWQSPFVCHLWPRQRLPSNSQWKCDKSAIWARHNSIGPRQSIRRALRTAPPSSIPIHVWYAYAKFRNLFINIGAFPESWRKRRKRSDRVAICRLIMSQPFTRMDIYYISDRKEPHSAARGGNYVYPTDLASNSLSASRPHPQVCIHPQMCAISALRCCPVWPPWRVICRANMPKNRRRPPPNAHSAAMLDRRMEQR